MHSTWSMGPLLQRGHWDILYRYDTDEDHAPSRLSPSSVIAASHADFCMIEGSEVYDVALPGKTVLPLGDWTLANCHWTGI
jgi:hypothetical protein